jgi:hypothetical protein
MEVAWLGFSGEGKGNGAGLTKDGSGSKLAAVTT